jgi:hypothetical protein
MESKFYVSLEAARLLREKGYDRECIFYYYDNCREVDYSFWGERNSTLEERCVSAPTKAEAIDWLESKGIMISVVYDNLGIIGKKHYRSIIDTLDKDGSESGLPIYLPSYDGYIRHYSTRLEAEEAAIIKALELL